MNQNTHDSGYLLIFRGTEDWHKGASAEDLQQVMGQMSAWLDNLTQKNLLKGANPLSNNGKVVRGAAGSSVTDGPFAESKEVVGGYFLLNVESEEQALEIARTNPMLKYAGTSMEVRPVAKSCPLAAEMGIELAGSGV